MYPGCGPSTLATFLVRPHSVWRCTPCCRRRRLRYLRQQVAIRPSFIEQGHRDPLQNGENRLLSTRKRPRRSGWLALPRAAGWHAPSYDHICAISRCGACTRGRNIHVRYRCRKAFSNARVREETRGSGVDARTIVCARPTNFSHLALCLFACLLSA